MKVTDSRMLRVPLEIYDELKAIRDKYVADQDLEKARLELARIRKAKSEKLAS